MICFSYKTITGFMNRLVLKASKISALNPIEMMAASLILGSVTYVYLFNLAKSSEILSAASIYDTSFLSTILYASPNDISFSPLKQQDLTLPAASISRIELKQLSIALSDPSNKHNMDTIMRFHNYIESTQLNFSNLDYQEEGAMTYKDHLCYNASTTCRTLKTIIKDNNIILSYVFDLNDDQRIKAAQLWDQKVVGSSLDKLVPMATQNFHSESISTVVWLIRVMKNIYRDTAIRMNVRNGHYI